MSSSFFRFTINLCHRVRLIRRVVPRDLDGEFREFHWVAPEEVEARLNTEATSIDDGIVILRGRYSTLHPLDDGVFPAHRILPARPEGLQPEASDDRRYAPVEPYVHRRA